MLILWSSYDVETADLGGYGRWVLDLAEQFKTSEPGCELYEPAVHPTKPASLVQFELFTSFDAFDGHMRNTVHDRIRHHDGHTLRNLRSRIFEVAREVPVSELQERVARIELERGGPEAARRLRQRWVDDSR